MLRVLENGCWHNLKEISEKTGIPIEELVSHCEVLSERELFEYDAESDRVRLGRKLKSIIEQLKIKEQVEAEWKKKGAGTIIIPSGKHCQVQSVPIHNLTKIDLQFEFKFDVKIREIAISEV